MRSIVAPAIAMSRAARSSMRSTGAASQVGLSLSTHGRRHSSFASASKRSAAKFTIVILSVRVESMRKRCEAISNKAGYLRNGGCATQRRNVRARPAGSGIAGQFALQRRGDRQHLRVTPSSDRQFAGRTAFPRGPSRQARRGQGARRPSPRMRGRANGNSSRSGRRRSPWDRTTPSEACRHGRHQLTCSGSC
jgi:hypothetical protein